MTQIDDSPDPRRREVIVFLGSLAAGALGCGRDSTASPSEGAAPSTSPSPLAAGAGAGMCVVRPSLTEGPFFVDERLNRSDIRTDPGTGVASPGVPLRLVFRVSRSSAGSCAPLAGAFVDVWHCDAAGVYSDVQAARGTRFLRGYQATDASGNAQFTTIFPGWYVGRAVHIHFKIRTSLTGGGAEFTSQLFFDEAVIAAVFAQAPYSSKGPADTTNARDGIYRGGGDQLLLALAREGSGYAATFDIALQF